LASDKIDNVLAEIFNKSIVAGEYPEKLKLAKIIPIFKSDDAVYPNNYRNISLLSNFFNLI
jgi:hypothetical protein